MTSNAQHYQALAKQAAMELVHEWITHAKELETLAEAVTTCEAAPQGLRELARRQHTTLIQTLPSTMAIAQRYTIPNVSLLFLKPKT